MAEKVQPTNAEKKTVPGQRAGDPAVNGLIESLHEMDPAALQRAIANPAAANPDGILALQQVAGNRAVGRLIQAKLTVGAAGDQYEQEADRVAELVVGDRRSASSEQRGVQRQEEEEVQTKPLSASITPLVQRGVEEEEEIQAKPQIQRQEDEEEIQTKPQVQRQEDEEEIQAKSLAQRQEDEEEIQTKSSVQRAADGSFEPGQAFEDRLAAHKGGGSPLPEGTQAFMEPRFGADFSGVRVHTGTEAAELNREISAQAFTQGHDIFVGEGRYNPGSEAGDRLLAHELTHVVQQSGSGAGKVSPPKIQRALGFNPANWSDTQEIGWVKGQDHPDHDNVLGFQGSGGSRLWVKTDESVAEASAAASLIAGFAQARSSRLGTMAAHREWKISTPQVREATREDRKKMVNKLGKIRPKPTRAEKSLLKATLLQKPNVHISTHAGGEMGDRQVPETQEPWLSDRSFRRALGYVGLLDLVLANFDRIIGMVGPQNWKVERPNATLHLIDNLQRGFGFDVSFEEWSENPWIALVRARNWAGMKTRLLAYWEADPQFQTIPHGQQDGWVNDFMAGMQEAWGDLGAVGQALNAAGRTNPKIPALVQRITYLRGWVAGVL